LIAAGLSSAVFYNAARNRVMADIRHRLSDIVSIASESVDVGLHSQLQSPEQQDSETYFRIKHKLQEIKRASSDIYGIYTMRRGHDQQIEFVVDAEEDPMQIANLGKVYDDASPFLRDNFSDLKKPVVEDTFYTDQWGTWLSGYAPFFNADGKLEGVIGIDIPADTVLEYQRELIVRSIRLFIPLLPIILILGFFISYRITRPIKAMEEAAEQISCGNYDNTVPVLSYDEIGMLACSLNSMSAKLKESNHKLKEIAEDYQNIFENAIEGIFQATPDGRLLKANNAMARVFGFDVKLDLLNSATGLNLLQYLEPADWVQIKDELYNDGQVTDCQLELKRHNGKVFCGELNARLITASNNNDYIIEGMIQDISGRLEREKLETDRKAAEEASRAKSEFLANMSHEIRTPLNAVMGLTDLIMKTEMTEKQLEYFKKIKISSKSLLAVINDILDFSKIEAGKLELEETDFSLYETIANLTEIFSYLANDKGIELLVLVDENVPGALRGDPVRLGQILNNLTSNALKFTEQGEVIITAKLAADFSATADENIIIEFCVCDTGTGIPADRIDSLFNAFTQADSSITRKHGGTGLGLAICQQLTHLMGGQIHIESEVGKGSSFIFTAVFKKSARALESRPTAPLDLRGLNILIVDDNKTAREILQSAIASFNMNPETAKSGEEALEKIMTQNPPFDLIILDWKMPNMNGLEIARHIKQQMNLVRVPKICMITAYGRSDLLLEAEKSLLDAFLYKPVNQSILLDTIVSIFGYRRGTAQSLASQTTEAQFEFQNFDGAKVLLVEDNEINQEIANEWLQSWGLEVVIANNGAEAVKLLHTQTVDAVLMDVQMPVMDGFEATQIIRRDLNLPKLPIIAMTAHALTGDREKCLVAGMDDYITKPIDPQLLTSVLQRWVMVKHPESKSETKKAPGQPSPDNNESLEIPGLSIEDGLYKANNNKKLYQKLLKSFAADFADASQRIADDIGRNYNDEARRLAHSIKGVAGNIGAKKLFAAARDLEDAIYNHNLIIDSDLWSDFSLSLAELIEGINRFLRTDIQPETAKPEHDHRNRNEVVIVLREIIDLLEEDLVQARTLFEEIEASLKRTLNMDKVQAISRYLDDFDIDSAILLLEDAITMLEKEE
ncbi:MAG: response regulator, partial [Syntrophomonadaceae bacterium]|nr:response regulator [Syntrophomonadaceae bacterium]